MKGLIKHCILEQSDGVQSLVSSTSPEHSPDVHVRILLSFSTLFTVSCFQLDHKLYVPYSKRNSILNTPVHKSYPNRIPTQTKGKKWCIIPSLQFGVLQQKVQVLESHLGEHADAHVFRVFFVLRSTITPHFFMKQITQMFIAVKVFF